MRYINTPESRTAFGFVRRSPFFVDKSGLLSKLCPFIGVDGNYVCVTRPRRFGKTTNARMIASFLSRDLDTAQMFEELQVWNDPSARTHLNSHDVVYIDFSLMPDGCEDYDGYVGAIRKGLLDDLRAHYPDCLDAACSDLFEAFGEVYAKTGIQFCFVVDEWDAMFFDSRFDRADQVSFLGFLKQLFKSRAYVEFVYMTGILPIAKHSSGSELNMFAEYAAANDPVYESFFGFSEPEVRTLCEKHCATADDSHVDFEGLAYWYDGYAARDGSRIFNPRSVVLALRDNDLRSYWTESGPYDEIYYYVKNDVAAVRDDLVRMVAGEQVPIRLREYSATARALSTKDEIFSAMVVYGFLTYSNGYVRIPNHELMLKFQDVLEKEELGYVAQLAQRSEEMLAATLAGDVETMAEILQGAHDQEVPLLRYAHEADLAALVNLV